MAKTPEASRETDAKGPSMSRSQAQIAMPSPNATPARLSQTTKAQIEMRIDETARAWFDKAITCRESDNTAPRAFPDFCVDVSLLIRRAANTRSGRRRLLT
jgi:hypothetical protein